MDIGTAKPTQAERFPVAHHFIDELEPREVWSAGVFAAEARRRIREIRGRSAVPIVVGGSTLYVEALVHGLADLPDGDPAVRATLNERVSSPEGARLLFEELRRVDPEGARRLDATKTQRLVRAMEVYRLTGKPWSSFLETTSPPPFRFRVVVLTRPREELYERINQRVDDMLASGLVEENRRLLNAGVKSDTIPLKTIGYQEPIAYLQGRLEYPEMVRKLKQNSRRYAKRQLTWFRRRPEYEWLDLASFDSPAEAADAILRDG